MDADVVSGCRPRAFASRTAAERVQTGARRRGPLKSLGCRSQGDRRSRKSRGAVCGVAAPPRCAPASPSSRLLASDPAALDRLSPIKVRGLLEEHPEHSGLLAGPGEVEILRTTTKVLVQILLLLGLLTVVSGFVSFGVIHPWAWGGATFLAGWFTTEVLLLRHGAVSDPEKLVARLLPVITSASWLLAPLAIPVRKIFEKRARQEASPATEEEVQAYIDVGREEGILEKEEEKLLLSIVDFGDTRVREVMTPRTDILWIDAAAPLPVLADLFVSSKYSRIPVVRGSIDTVLGIIHVKDLFEAIHAGKPR